MSCDSHYKLYFEMFNHGILGDSNRINKAVFVYKCIADAPTEKIYHI